MNSAETKQTAQIQANAAKTMRRHVTKRMYADPKQTEEETSEEKE